MSTKVALIIGVMLTTCGVLHAATVLVVKDKAPAPQLNVSEFDQMVYASESSTPVYNYFKYNFPFNALSYLAGVPPTSTNGAGTSDDQLGGTPCDGPDMGGGGNSFGTGRTDDSAVGGLPETPFDGSLQ